MATTRDAVVIERRDLVVCPLAGSSTRTPFRRTCHFLQPCFASSHRGPFPDPPRVSPPLPHSLDPACPEFPPGIRFNYAAGPDRGWVDWVKIMEPLHCPAWRKAGILEAIRCSTYRIQRDQGLIVGLAEKWCPDTSSFVFPWGEASVTLEDVHVLWGCSVSPSPVLTEDDEMVEIESRLKVARSKIVKSKAKKACSGRWMASFKGSGSDIEHEAFLAFWLSRFVFPSSSGAIYDDLFPIAIHMARGHKVAIAPAVLASIYRELRLLKTYICDLAAGKLDYDSRCCDLPLWAPLGILQVWAWERFVHLRPRPGIIRPGEPRLSRRDKVRCSELKNLRAVLDRIEIDADSNFEWRPYTKEVENFKVPSFYSEHGRWERLCGDDSEDQEEMLVFTRCLVPCELEGLESTERYLPHRVAMQFGMDQNIPDCVSRYEQSAEVNWKSYYSPFHGKWVYLPPRGSTQFLTKQYDDWRSSRPKDGPVERLKEEAKGCDGSVPPGFSPIPRYVIENESRGEVDQDKEAEGCDGSVPPGFTPIRRYAVVDESSNEADPDKEEEGNDVSAPPGFSPIPRYAVTDESSDEADDDNLTLRERRSKLARQRDVQRSSSMPERPSKLQRSTVSAGEKQSPSESRDDDHSTSKDLHSRQHRSIDADRNSIPFKSNMDSARPPESPPGINVVISSESDGSSDEHEPIQVNASADRTCEEESAASLGRSKTVFLVDMLVWGVNARIGKLERDVSAL